MDSRYRRHKVDPTAGDRLHTRSVSEGRRQNSAASNEGTVYEPQNKLEKENMTLKSRLMATLNAWDNEREQMTNERHALLLKLYETQERAVQVDAERDRMRDVVNSLLLKVEADRNLSFVSPPAIQCDYLLDESVTIPDSVVAKPQSDPYASSLLATLSAQLDAERTERLRITKELNAKVTHLHAQLAHRDAEEFGKSFQIMTSARGDENEGASVLLTAAGRGALRPQKLVEEIKLLFEKVQELRNGKDDRTIRPESTAETSTESEAITDETIQILNLKADDDVPTQDPEILFLEAQKRRLVVERDRLQRAAKELQTRRSDQGPNDGRVKDHTVPHTSEFRRLTLLEEECIRLRASEIELKQELEISRAQVATSEKRIELLESKLSEAEFPLLLGSTPRPPLAGIDAEEAMAEPIESKRF